MKDREQNQLEGVQLPPAWCSGICRNAMNEVCVEHCAVKRDCSGFDEKPNLTLSDLPRFPETKGMTKEEKFTSVTVYLSKVVDHLQGRTNESKPVIRRTHPKRDTGGQIFTAQQAERVLHAFFEEKSPHPTNSDPSDSSGETSD